MNRYAYIRVSTKDQNIDRQIAALEQFNIPDKNIFCDRQSGKDFNRPQYQMMLKKLKKGDLLIVKSIDRLGRNYNEILKQWQHITKDVKADIVVLDMDLLDTRQRPENLTGTLIADLVLQLFAYVAQTEREAIHQRQAEGIAVARSKGKRFGRPSIELPDEFGDICDKCEKGVLTTRKGAEILGLSHSTFYRHYACRRKSRSVL